MDEIHNKEEEVKTWKREDGSSLDTNFNLGWFWITIDAGYISK